MQEPMDQIRSGEARGYMSTVNIAEFHRAVTRLTNEEKADTLVKWIVESEIRVIPVTTEIACQASIMKEKYASAKDPFAWGDAFCLATALEMHADVVVTIDTEFNKVDEVDILMV